MTNHELASLYLHTQQDDQLKTPIRGGFLKHLLAPVLLFHLRRAFESGESITYGLFNAQERGTLFIGAGTKVYAGMVIGQTGKTEDIEVNVCKKKQLTNTRASGSDDALKLTPPKIMSLEQCLEFIDTNELLEITPKNLRIRKKILDPTLRKRAERK